jgi:hypothetical protein
MVERRRERLLNVRVLDAEMEMLGELAQSESVSIGVGQELHSQGACAARREGCEADEDEAVMERWWGPRCANTRAPGHRKG